MSDRAIDMSNMVPTNNQVRARPWREALLCDMDLPFSRTFYPLGFAITILTNRHQVLAAAEASFGHSNLRHGDAHLEIRIGVSESTMKQTPPNPVRREYNHLYLMMADVENQAVLDLRTGSNFAWVSDSAVRDEVYLRHNFLEKIIYLLLGASVVTDIHAGCISKRGKGILLCGDSGAGKSTLSYGCARAGWTYTSDDTCYLLNDSEPPRVVGHSHRLRFRPEAQFLFPELRNRYVTQRMDGKLSIEVSVSELPRLETLHEVRVAGVVYLRRSTCTPAGYLSLPHGSASQRLSEELYSAGEIRLKHEEALGKLAEIPAFELHYDSLEEAISQLDRLVELL